MKFLIFTLMLTTVVSAQASSCKRFAERANLSIIKLNGENGGGPLSESVVTAIQSPGVSTETYRFHNSIPSGLVDVQVEILQMPSDDTSQECTVSKILWGVK